MSVWQVQTAKSRLSELIEDAKTQGPQIITRHGTEQAVVLSIGDYRNLAGTEMDFKQFLLSGAKVDELEVEREQDNGRGVDL